MPAPDIIELMNKVGLEMDFKLFDECCKAVGKSDTNMNLKCTIQGLKKLGMVQ